MNQWNCLIVDDEPIALEIVENYCQQLSNLNVVGLCKNALEAREALQLHHVDILFIDINMPVLSGLAFIKTLKKMPQVIFTTAYKEYAVDAFDLAACDYLLKPFSLERFIVAVDKAVEKLLPTQALAPTTREDKNEDFTFLKAEGKLYKVFFNEVLYVEASGNYTRIVTAHQTFLPAITLSATAEMLPNHLFLQAHRSFLINKSKITHLEGNRVFIGAIELPIGSNYKERFLEDLGL
jgi:DNA-binding LytR/AlgR family response regulator